MCGFCAAKGWSGNVNNTDVDGCMDDQRVNCTEIFPEVCTSDLKYRLCPRTCGECDEAVNHPEKHCQDQVNNDLTCADLDTDGVCNDDLGRIACPVYCGNCAQSTTMAPFSTGKTSQSTSMTTHDIPKST